jgi:hypothetical protein
MKLRYYMRGLGIGIFVTAILMAVTIHGKTERLTDEQIIERAEALGMEMKYSSDVLADTVSENTAEDTKPAELPNQVKEETSLANRLAAEEKTGNPLLAGAGVDSSADEQDNNAADTAQQDIYHEDPDAAERTEAKTDTTDRKEQTQDGSVQENAAGEKNTAQNVSADAKAAGQDEGVAGETSAADTQTVTGAAKQITVSSGDGSDTVARKLYEAGLISDASAYDRYLCQNGYDKKICTGVKTIPAGATEAEIAQILTTR